MSIRQAFMLEVERETANTKKLIRLLVGHDISWKPHERSMSIGALVSHIVGLHSWVHTALEVDDFNLATDFIPFKADSIATALDRLSQDYEKNVHFVNNASEASWEESWRMRFGDHLITTCPRKEAFRYIIYNHLIHHRGQLSVYLRLLGIPVPGLYGPSADDKQ